MYTYTYTYTYTYMHTYWYMYIYIYIYICLKYRNSVVRFSLFVTLSVHLRELRLQLPLFSSINLLASGMSDDGSWNYHCHYWLQACQMVGAETTIAALFKQVIGFRHVRWELKLQGESKKYTIWRNYRMSKKKTYTFLSKNIKNINIIIEVKNINTQFL